MNPGRARAWIALMSIGSGCGRDHDVVSASTTAPLIVASQPVGSLPGGWGITATGTATYAVPLEVPPGAGGLVPSLAFAFDSSAGNGALGLGWLLVGTSGIALCPHPAETQSGHFSTVFPVLGNGGDNYCLDGRLLVLASGVHGGLGATYYTQPYSGTRVRVNGVANGEPAGFIVETADGLTTDYGGVPGRVTVALAQSPLLPATNRTIQWLARRTRDRSGNEITTSYDIAVTSLSVAEIKLASIEYGRVAGGAPLRRVRFTHEPRPDVLSYSITGATIRTTTRLARVTTEVLAGASATPVKSYRLTYTTSARTARSLLASIAVCDAGEVCLPPTTFGWAGTQVAFAPTALPAGLAGRKLLAGDLDGDGRDDLAYLAYVNASTLPVVAVTSLATATGYGPTRATSTTIPIGNRTDPVTGELVDVTGDGRADLVIDAQRVIVRGEPEEPWAPRYLVPSRGDGTFDAPVSDPTWKKWRGIDTNARPTPAMFVDLNGDGLPDDVELYQTAPQPNLWRYRLRTPDAWGGTTVSWSPWTAFSAQPGTELEARATGAIDLDGRGRAALLAPALASNDHRIIRYGLNGDERSWLSPADCTVLLDQNGDGLVDRVHLSDVWTDENDGRNFQLTPGGAGAFFTAADCEAADPGVRVGDFDGDGHHDILAVMRGGPEGARTTIRLLTRPSAFEWLRELDTGIAAGAVGDPGYLALDANGDGLLDFISGGTTLYTQTGKRDQLETITDGLGGTTRINYDSLTALAQRGRYVPGAGCAYPQQCSASRMSVVSSIELDRGDAPPLVIEEGYEDPRHDLVLGFLGFRKRWSRNTTTGARIDTRYHMTPVAGRYPYRGLVEDVTTYVQLDATCGYTCLPALWSASHTVNTYDRKLVLGDAVDIPYVQTSRTRHYEGAAFDPAAPDSTQLTTEIATTLALDDHGNATHRETVWAGAHGVEAREATDITYLNDATTWTIGLPRTIRTTSTSAWMPPYTVPPRSATREIELTYDTYGRLYETIREPDDAAYRQVTRIAQRSWTGMPQRIETVAGATTRATVMTYDPDEAFVTSTTNGAGVIASATWHPGLGVMLSSQPAQDVPASTMDYDGFGRLRAVHAPDGSSTATSFSSAPGAPLVITEASSSGAERVVSYDRLGREVQVSARALDGADRFTETTYDALGRVRSVTRPHRAGATGITAATYDHDKLDRIWKVTAGDGATTTYQRSYRVANQRHQVQVLDADGRRSAAWFDAKGRTQALHTYPVTDNQSTSSEYGPFDQLEAVNHGSRVQIEYDKIGRRVRLVDGDIGEQRTTYNGFDQVLTETDGRGVTVTNHYDTAGRLVSRTAGAADAGTADTFTYDTAPGSGLGRLATATRDNITAAYTYDALGRLAQKRTTVGGTAYDVEAAYDAQGRLSTIKYPIVPGTPRLEVTRELAVNGAPLRVRGGGSGNPLWEVLQVDDEGRVSRERRDGTERRLAFEPVTGRLASIAVHQAGNSTPRQTTAYRYSAAGLPVERTMTGSSVGKETFVYDGVQQLTKVVTESAGVTETKTYAYDASGNLTATSEGGGCAMFYGEAGAGPHVLTRTQCGSTTSTFVTDAAGNQTSAPGRTVTYNSFHKPSTLDGHGFEYDANHRRTRKSKGDALDHVYIDGLYERRTENGITNHTFYAHAGGERIAVGRQLGSFQRTFAALNSDLLGTPTAVGLGGAQSFDAWGQRRDPLALNTLLPASAPWPVDSTIGFTGHRHDRELDVIDMGGRIYDPKHKRFLSADPAVQGAHSGWAWNHYRYARNSPVLNTDPSGNIICTITPSGIVCGPGPQPGGERPRSDGGTGSGDGDHTPVNPDGHDGQPWHPDPGAGGSDGSGGIGIGPSHGGGGNSSWVGPNGIAPELQTRIGQPVDGIGLGTVSGSIISVPAASGRGAIGFGLTGVAIPIAAGRMTTFWSGRIGHVSGLNPTNCMTNCWLVNGPDHLLKTIETGVPHPAPAAGTRMTTINGTPPVGFGDAVGKLSRAGSGAFAEVSIVDPTGSGGHIIGGYNRMGRIQLLDAQAPTGWLQALPPREVQTVMIQPGSKFLMAGRAANVASIGLARASVALQIVVMAKASLDGEDPLADLQDEARIDGGVRRNVGWAAGCAQFGSRGWVHTDEVDPATGIAMYSTSADIQARCAAWAGRYGSF